MRSCHLCASAPKKLTHHREISIDHLRLELQRETIKRLLGTWGFLEKTALGRNSSGSSIAKERRGNQAPHPMLFAHNIIKLLPSGLFNTLEKNVEKYQAGDVCLVSSQTFRFQLSLDLW